MRVLFAGTPAAALPTLVALRDAGHEVVAVATNPDARSGRGRGLAASPVALAARGAGIPLLQPARAREPWFREAVAALAPDVAVVVAWGTLIPDTLLAVPTHGWINVHFSLLPGWRGAAPVQRAIMAGEKITGVTTFRLVHDLDAGPVYRQAQIPIGADTTAGEVLDELSYLGAKLLVDTLLDVANNSEPQVQIETEVTLAPKVTVDDACLDWGLPACQVHNRVRGVTPAPGAWTTYAGQRLKIGGTAVVTGPQLAPGELSASKQALLAGTGDGVVRLVSVQAPGKPLMDGAAWARGARLHPGVRLE